MFKWIKNKFSLGLSPWPKKWREQLGEILNEAQQGLSMNLVVVVARESDLYAELLYLLSFIGMSFAAIFGLMFSEYFNSMSDFLVLPVIGFASGSSLFALRSFYVKKIIPRRVRDAVRSRAKSLFYDHYQQLGSRTAVVLISELERESLMMVSPDLAESFPTQKVHEILKELMLEYEISEPLPSLRKHILNLSLVIREAGVSANAQVLTQAALLIGATDRPLDDQRVVILKGNKDIN